MWYNVTIKVLYENRSNDILFRRYFLSQPVKDIADYYEMKSNSVSKRITRALEVLRGRLEAYYYGH